MSSSGFPEVISPAAAGLVMTPLHPASIGLIAESIKSNNILIISQPSFVSTKLSSNKKSADDLLKGRAAAVIHGSRVVEFSFCENRE